MFVGWGCCWFGGAEICTATSTGTYHCDNHNDQWCTICCKPGYFFPSFSSRQGLSAVWATLPPYMVSMQQYAWAVLLLSTCCLAPALSFCSVLVLVMERNVTHRSQATAQGHLKFMQYALTVPQAVAGYCSRGICGYNKSCFCHVRNRNRSPVSTSTLLRQTTAHVALFMAGRSGKQTAALAGFRTPAGTVSAQHVQFSRAEGGPLTKQTDIVFRSTSFLSHSSPCKQPLQVPMCYHRPLV